MSQRPQEEAAIIVRQTAPPEHRSGLRVVGAFAAAVVAAPAIAGGAHAVAEGGPGTHPVVRFVDGMLFGYVHPGQTLDWILGRTATKLPEHATQPSQPARPSSGNTAKTTPSSAPKPSDIPVVLPKPIVTHSWSGPKPVQKKNGVVQGASAFYRGFSVAEVQDMEHCGNESKRVLLTFDDYGTPEHLQDIADVLTAHNAGALFFPNSGKVDQSVIDSLRRQGFWVGNHTATHPDLVPLDAEATKQAILSGGKATLFRPTYGATYTEKGSGRIFFKTEVSAVAASVGKRICMWTLDTQDWKKGQTAEGIVKAVASRVHPGDVILMHQNDEYPTVRALPGVIAAIRAAGLELCPNPQVATSQEIPAVLPCAASR